MDELREQGDAGPLIPDDRFADYQARRETILSGGGVHIDAWDDQIRISMGEEAHRQTAADAEAAGLDMQTYLQYKLEETAARMFPKPELTRQQRRHQERQARKKAES